MAVPILMPSLSPTMTEGSIAKWCKNIGDEVKPGDIIVEIETDKATMEIEAVDEGILEKILYNDGDEGITVNSLIAVLKNKSDTEKEIKDILDKHQIKENEDIVIEVEDENKVIRNDINVIDEVVEGKDIDKTVSETASVKKDLSKDVNLNQRVSISPLAKRLIFQNNINIEEISGSGPRGRIVKKDLDFLLNKNNNLNKNIKNIHKDNKVKKISSMRKIIAERLSLSKQEIPHFYLTVNCVVDNLLIARKEMNSGKNDEEKISINDIIIKALSLALIKVPEANCKWGVKEITYFSSVDISVAVAVDDGLFTPVIRNADSLNISEISLIMKDYISLAKVGKLMPKDYEGGNFSISNLGMYNIDSFSAIINPPQSGILAIGAIKNSPIAIENEVRLSNVMSCQLSGDHRAIDGAVGAKLLSEFKDIIENPYKMLV